MNITQSQSLTVLLDKHAHRYAQQFAAQQATPQKGKQVYLNTLAVYAVHSYLKWLPIETALHQSDCWHPGLRAIFDLADLVLPSIGKLECRPLLPTEQALVLPPEVTDNRIGYVAVQFREQLDQVQLLGFVPGSAMSKSPEPIPVAQLQSLDSLIDAIHRWRFRVSLRQWFEGIFQQEWQPVESLLATQGRLLRTASDRRRFEDITANNSTPEFPERSISRGKIINWESDETEQAVILVVKVTEKSVEEVDLCLRLYPFGESDRLPPGLQVTLLDESGTSCLEAQTKNADDWIQLDFSCQPEERFSVRIALGETSIAEQFVV